MPRGWTENLGGGLKAGGVILLGFKKKCNVGSIRWKMNAWDTLSQETTSQISLLRSLENSLGQVLSQVPELPLHFRVPGSIQQWGQLNKTHHCLQGLVHKCSLFTWQWRTATANTRHGCSMPFHFTAALPWQPARTWRASRFVSKWVFCSEKKWKRIMSWSCPSH